jgi:hypothetical protein
MNKNTSIQKLASNTYKNPALQAILSLIEDVPIVGTVIGASRAGLEQRLSNMIENRKAVFFDELERGGLITSEMLEKEEFIHSFIVVYRAATNTYQRDKIRRFAHLLLNAIEENQLASDKFEEFCRILEDLSEREIFILKILRKYEINYPNQEVTHKWQNGESTELENDGMRFNRLWDDLSSEIGTALAIDGSTLRSILVSLSRTGLYDTFIQLDHIYGSGKTTPLFDEFAKWIQLESEKDSNSNAG